MAELHQYATPVARLAHHCETCNATITPGARYRRDRYLFDGRFFTWKQCLECAAVADAVLAWISHPEEGAGWDDYQEWAQESVDDPQWGEQARALLARVEEARAVPFESDKTASEEGR